MQKTRQKILEYLKQHGEATVDEISILLDELTPVTVRHHLDVLRSEGLVGSPEIRHRASPGRPKYVYRLTEKAEGLFPNNLQTMLSYLLDEMKHTLSPQQIRRIIQGVATQMAETTPLSSNSETIETRLDRLVAYLVEHGYMASWETRPEGFILLANNCPYGDVPGNHPEMCSIDVSYISMMLGMTPKRLTHQATGDVQCSFLIPHPE
ncbi:MAG: ArsR family transcriptional regulator [Anaerolineae bacterium]|nr:ArsR family transcriptional regulator [Anaerolineae bacterium]